MATYKATSQGQLAFPYHVGQPAAAGAGVNLRHFQLPRKMEDRLSWFLWPLLSLATDQGSVDKCAKHFSQDSLVLNLDDVDDPGHCTWNDTKLACKAAQLWPHLTCMMIAWNVPHGPWSEDRRYGEVCRLLDHLFAKTKRAEDSWLFYGASS